jgi:hypothetical protein
MLRNEGERVSREIAGYASLTHASMTAMTVIADSLKQWKTAPDKLRPRSARCRYSSAKRHRRMLPAMAVRSPEIFTK